MYVSFPVSQRELLRRRERTHRRISPASRSRSASPTASIYEQVGEINFVDVSVDRSTDTVLARATMPNPDGALIDGQLVQVILEAATPRRRSWCRKPR